MQTNLETIRAACIKANPSILDLELGCGLSVSSPSYKRYFTGSNEEEEEWFFIEVDQVGCEDTAYSREGYVKDLNKDAIIGRPIRLSDVIHCIQVNKEEVNKGAYSPDSDITQLATYDWDCTRDDLTQQREETISFIAELLK